MRRRLFLAALGLALTTTGALAQSKRYDFRTSAAYQALKPEQREGLEQVHRDFVLLWGALDLYIREHDDRSPENLEALVPLYLKELPLDPFATPEAAQKPLGQYLPSRGGRGYRYCRGQDDSFIIASVGLPGFPYLAASGNVDLYLPRGIWLSGRQLGFRK